MCQPWEGPSLQGQPAPDVETQDTPDEYSKREEGEVREKGRPVQSGTPHDSWVGGPQTLWVEMVLW